MHTMTQALPARRLHWRVLRTAMTSSGISILFHVAIILLVLHFALGPRLDKEVKDLKFSVVEEIQPEFDKLDDLDEIDDILQDIPQQTMQALTEIVPEELVMEDTPPAVEDTPDITSVLTFTTLADNGLSDDQLRRGGGSAFGFGDKARGDLVGAMYDLKRDNNGRAREANFMEDLRTIMNARLDAKAFKNFFRVPRPLYLTHLYVPYMDAQSGPEAFGVGDLMESSNWIVHYGGYLQTAIAGRYRFVGAFDDLLVVMVDGQLVHEFKWSGDPSAWAPKDRVEQDGYRDKKLVYGDWFDLAPLRNRRVDILVGEHPGGHVGGLLMIEREGETYETAADGRPILPIFALQPLTEAEEQRLYSATDWKFARRVPIMGARQDELQQNASRKNDDVTISIQ